MTTRTHPIGELDPRFSSPGAEAVPWDEAERRLEEAPVYWASIAGAHGQLHSVPLLAVWLDEALFFCTRSDEGEARDLELGGRCILTTGCGTPDEGLDLVVEGDAVRVTDPECVARVADAFDDKYGSDWSFMPVDGAFEHHDHEATVFAVAPRTVLGFGKGTFGRTRWRFAPPPAP